MGFLTKLFKFFHLNEHTCGFVNGGPYDGFTVKTIQEENNGPLKICFYQKEIVIGQKKKEPYTFSKEDLKNVTLLQSGVTFSGRIASKHYIGNRYQLEFKNGSTAIVSCPMENAPYFEKAIF